MNIKEVKKNIKHAGEPDQKRERVVRISLGKESARQEDIRGKGKVIFEKPENDSKKRRIAKIGIALIMAIVFGLWILTVKTSIEKLKPKEDADNFKSLSEDFKKGIENILSETEKLKQLKTVLERSASTTFAGGENGTTTVPELAAADYAATSTESAASSSTGSIEQASSTLATGTIEQVDYKEIKKRIKDLEADLDGKQR
jgi:hypothetical protein